MLVKSVLITAVAFSIIVALPPASAFAQDSEASPTPVQYDLSYPGLLPGHPFYFLKNARDTMVGFFIGQPVDKAAFALKQSDKHLMAATLVLKQKDDVQMAKESFDASQRYFEDAITNTLAAQKQGMSVEEMINTLQTACRKHQLVIEDTYDSLSVEEKKLLEDERKNADKLLKQVATLKP